MHRKDHVCYIVLRVHVACIRFLNLSYGLVQCPPPFAAGHLEQLPIIAFYSPDSASNMCTAYDSAFVLDVLLA